MFMSSKLTAVETELNLNSTCVLSHIIAYSYQNNRFVTSNVINGAKIMYVSCDFTNSSSGDKCVEITPEEILETGSSLVLSEPLRISSSNAWNYLDVDLIKAEHESHIKYNQVIIGPINLIPEDVLNILIQYFRASDEIYLYGDPLVDSPEFFNHHMNYLTNSSLAIKLDYSLSRLSGKKKINKVLSKMRKELLDLSEISISTSVSISNDNNINYAFIKDFLEEDPNSTVIVPRRLFSEINSALYTDRFKTDDLNLQPMVDYYFKFPFEFIGTVVEGGNTNYKNYAIKAMTRFNIITTNYTFINTPNNRKYINVDMILPDDNNCILKSVDIDLDDFFLQFHPDLHPTNHADLISLYDTADSSDNFFNFDVNSAKICISRMCTPDLTKYFRNSKALSFIELINRDTNMFANDDIFYKYFCNTLDEINIIYADEFN